MSPEREWDFRVKHIVDAIEKIMRYTAAMTYEEFAADERTNRSGKFGTSLSLAAS